MQFGAKNDGTTDSTTFVQAAIDAARLSTSKVVRITGRIYCASDIDYSGVKLSGDCAGWVAGSGMDAVEDYPSIMLLGSNSLDATDGGGVIDGLFVVQKTLQAAERIRCRGQTAQWQVMLSLHILAQRSNQPAFRQSLEIASLQVLRWDYPAT